MRRTLAAALLALGLLAGACASPTPETEVGSGPTGSRPGGGNQRPAARTPVGDPAPDFEVRTFDGTTFSLAEERGTPVVLNFWESW